MLIRILLFLIGTLSSTLIYSKKREQSAYIKHVKEVENSFIREMKKEGFHCYLTSGQMPYDVVDLGIGFELVLLSTRKGRSNRLEKRSYL